ncbi:MAG: hypothetical protein V4593_17325 [Pseudomonadota bacterium]
MSRVLRCGVQGLPAAEASLVRTLFRLYQHGASDFRWVLVDTPPYDALLVDFTAQAAGATPGHEAVKAILTVGHASPGSLPNTLARPLRSEMLEAWLLQAQRRFFPESSPADALGTPETSPITAATPLSCKEAGSYKLLRWPPAAMLRNDARLIRMATVLSRRPVTASELARVSQQPLDSACSFLTTLRTAALLDSPRDAQPQLQPGPENTLQRSVHPGQKIERSLMSRIRLRLGL